MPTGEITGGVAECFQMPEMCNAYLHQGWTGGALGNVAPSQLQGLWFDPELVLRPLSKNMSVGGLVTLKFIQV